MPATLPSDTNPERRAQTAADRLATALEEVGFDVGCEFTMLQGRADLSHEAQVELGQISVATAIRLASVLTDAAGRGVTLPIGDDY